MTAVATGRLAGLGILVVGGGSGIGRAAVAAYLREGARLTVVERCAEHAAALRELGEHHPVEVVEGDGTTASVLADAVATATAGGQGLDQLTCCVGVFDHYASLREIGVDDLLAAGEEIWRVNVLGTFAAVAAAWPALRTSRGSVTFTLSESAFRPAGGGVLYGSTKWALRGAVAHLAVDLAPYVRVNGVAPGGTTGTGFSGLAALGEDTRSVADTAGRDARIAAGTLIGVTPTPQDHGEAFVYLADPIAARVLTGQIVNTDGGHAW